MADSANTLKERLKECEFSAQFWATHIGKYADGMQARADKYAIMACVISAITGLGSWATIAASPKVWCQAIMGVMGLAAAVVAMIPKTRGYGDCAVKASPLSTEYGHVYGVIKSTLARLSSGDQRAETDAQEAIRAFEAVREKKENLHPFPRKLEDEINELRKSGTKGGI